MKRSSCGGNALSDTASAFAAYPLPALHRSGVGSSASLGPGCTLLCVSFCPHCERGALSPGVGGPGWPPAPGCLPAQLCVSAAPAEWRGVRDQATQWLAAPRNGGQVTTWLKGRGRRGQGAAWWESLQDSQRSCFTTGVWCDLTDPPGTSSFCLGKCSWDLSVKSNSENLLEGNNRGRDVCIIQRFPLKCQLPYYQKKKKTSREIRKMRDNS